MSFETPQRSLDPFEPEAAKNPDLKLYTGKQAGMTGQEFCALFQRRHEYARLLLELSKTQQELISQAEYSGLIDLLLKKQTALDALQKLSQTNPPLLELWKSKRDELTAMDREQCEQWLSASEQILSELMEHEQTCTDQLQEKREHTRVQLEAVSSTIHVQDAYNQPEAESQFDRSQ